MTHDTETREASQTRPASPLESACPWRASHRWWRRQNTQGLLLILPALLTVALLAIAPALTMLQLSFRKYGFGEDMARAPFVGRANYERLLFNSSSQFWHSVKLTLIFSATGLTVELALGLVVALLLNRVKWGKSILTAGFIVPMVLTPAMVGMIWRLYYSYDGLINFFLQLISGQRLNWYSPQWALPAVIIVDIWQWTPFFILIFYAGLQSLPSEPFEAATVDGASAWQMFRHLTLPMIAPLTVIAAILRTMDILRLFDVIYAIFAGGPGTATQTLPLYIYVVTLVRRDVGLGSAASVLLIVLMLLSSLVLVTLLRRYRYEAY